MRGSVAKELRRQTVRRGASGKRPYRKVKRWWSRLTRRLRHEAMLKLQRVEP